MSVELRATYRLQFHAGFGFADAAAIGDYLARLGISHVYASPYLQAAPGSTHGYDVVNHQRVNEELGGAAAHTQMCTALKEMELGQVLEQVWSRIDDGSPKLWVNQKTLNLRKCGNLLRPQDLYRALGCRGSKANHVVAFARGERAVAVAPRLTLMRAGQWGDTSVALPQGRWRNEFTAEAYDGHVPMKDLLKRFPVALLIKENG